MVEIQFKGHIFDTGLIMVFISGFVLLLWIILKLFRIIQTPLFFEILPIIIGLGAIFGFGISVGKVLQVVKQLQDNSQETNRRLDSLNDDHILLKSDFKYFVMYKKSLSS